MRCGAMEKVLGELNGGKMEFRRLKKQSGGTLSSVYKETGLMVGPQFPQLA